MVDSLLTEYFIQMVVVLPGIPGWESTASPVYSGLSDHCTTRFARSAVPSPTKYYPQGSGDKELRVRGLACTMKHISVVKRILTYNRIDDQFHVKLTDMALSRDFFPNDYHCLGDNENRPIKWMAMESLTRREFSTSSDIVSFILL